MFCEKIIDDLVVDDIKKSKLLNSLIRDCNAILAGGASHALMSGQTVMKYMKAHNSADLDLYFRSEKEYIHAISHVKRNFLNTCTIEKSPTGLCYNLYDLEHEDINKIQLVGCVFGSPENIVSTFDFKNLEVFCYFDATNFKLGYSSNAKNKKHLLIRHSRSPFLLHRVYKYMSYRGYSGVSKSSRKHITDWIIKASSGFYEENTDNCPAIYVDLLNNPNFIKMIKNKNVISDEDLVYMIGKIKEPIYESVEVICSRGYHTRDFYPRGEKDLIIEEIKRRSL